MSILIDSGANKIKPYDFATDLPDLSDEKAGGFEDETDLVKSPFAFDGRKKHDAKKDEDPQLSYDETTCEVQESPSTLRKSCMSTDLGEHSKNDTMSHRVIATEFAGILLWMF
jgi:hypothetical protein